MATRMNIMKLMQEVRGLAEFPGQFPATRGVAPFLLDQFLPKLRNPRLKRTLRIIVQDPPDIPNPVKIIHLSASARGSISRGGSANCCSRPHRL